jgi:hypothetical protein
MKGEKKTVGGADSRRVAAVVSSGLDSVGCGFASETLIFSSSLSFYPTTLYRALQVVVFKTNLVFFFILFILFLVPVNNLFPDFRNTTKATDPSSPFIGCFVVVFF